MEYESCRLRSLWLNQLNSGSSRNVFFVCTAFTTFLFSDSVPVRSVLHLSTTKIFIIYDCQQTEVVLIQKLF